MNVFSSVISPLATVKPLSRSSPMQPADCRPDMFLCKLWRILLNIKFHQEYKPPREKLSSLWERIWEKWKMKLKCLLMLYELLLRDTKVMPQENAAPLRTQDCPVYMFKSAFLHCRNSFILNPVIPLEPIVKKKCLQRCLQMRHLALPCHSSLTLKKTGFFLLN